MSQYVPSKDPNDIVFYYYIFCSRDGTNDGSATDTGVLQGATITSATVTPDAGLTLDTSNTAAVTIKGVSYAANTVVTAKFSGGTVPVDYDALCRVVLSDTRQLDRTIIIPVREN